MLGDKKETSGEETPVEQSVNENESQTPLSPVQSGSNPDVKGIPTFETSRKSEIRNKIELLRGYLKGNNSIEKNTLDGVLRRLDQLDQDVNSSWLSPTLDRQYGSILQENPELNGYQENLGKIESLARILEKKEQSGGEIVDADLQDIAADAAKFVQSFPDHQNEKSPQAVKEKQNTLFEVFKKITGVKSENNYDKLDEKGQAKALQKEALKHLSLFERILVTINVNFLHKDNPAWLKDHLFKKVSIPYLAKVEILKFFYPDRDPNTLRKTEEDDKKKDDQVETTEVPITKTEGPKVESPVLPKSQAKELSQPNTDEPTPTNLEKKEEDRKITQETPIYKREAISKTRTLEQLLKNRSSKESLNVFGESILGNVSETADRVNELLVEDLKKYDTTTRLNGLTNQVNKLIYEFGTIPSEEEITDVFNKIRGSESFTSKDQTQSDIVEKSIRQMIHIRNAENGLMNSWLQEAVKTSTSKEGKEFINGDMVEQIFTKKLIDHIIDYRINLPEGQKGRLQSQQEADALKGRLEQSINSGKIKVEFYQVGQIHVPILLIDDYQEQANLYGSNNPKDRDKVSPGRFFFDGKLETDSNGEEVPMLLSSISFITEDYEMHPELLKHELVHATHELQQHAQREVFRENYRSRTLNSNLVRESLIKFILSGDSESRIQSLNKRGIEVPETTLLLVKAIKEKASEQDIQYFITGGYQKSEVEGFTKTEGTAKSVEKTDEIRKMIKESPYITELKTAGAKNVSADLIQQYIETGTSGVFEFDKFIRGNHQLDQHVTRIGEIYNRFYNPVNEAVSSYVSSDRNINLGDLKIPDYDKNNHEVIGGMALVRLLNEHNRSSSQMVTPEQIELFIKEKEYLANYLNSSPLYKNGRVTIGNMMEILTNSLSNENDPIHELLNVVVPSEEGDIDQEYLSKLKDTIPIFRSWLGSNKPTTEQYRILTFLFPDELLNNFDETLEEESQIGEEDYGIGKAINPDPLMRRAVTNTYIGSEFRGVSPNKRSGQGYGGKLDMFTRPYMPKDTGNQLLQFWGWNSKTFTDGFGIGSNSKFRLDSIDPLEAIGFATGIPIHRLPFLENLREKILTKDAYYPETYVSPSPRAYTAGVFKDIYTSIMNYGRLDDMSAITLMTKIGGYNFNLQGSPTLSLKTWIQEDEYRSNDLLANFVDREIDNLPPKDKKNIVDRLRGDVIQSKGKADMEVGKFKVGQMSKGYLEDILGSMVMGEYPEDKPLNEWGHARMEWNKERGKVERNQERMKSFKRIGAIMMAADYAKNVKTIVNSDGTSSEVYTGDHTYTLLDLYEAMNTAQLVLPGSLYDKGDVDKNMKNVYENQSFTINIDGKNVGEGINGGEDDGVITLKDAKEFLEFAIIARAEKVVSVGVWGKDTEKDESVPRIDLPNDQRQWEDFITTNQFSLTNQERILKKGDDYYKLEMNTTTGIASLYKITEKYSKTAKVKTGQKIYGGQQELTMDHIENFTPDQMEFFFGKKEQYTTKDKDGNIIDIDARKGYKLNKGLIYDSVLDSLDKINQGKRLSFQYSMKLLQTDRYREFSKMQMEFWNGMRNIDNFYRFIIIAASAVGAIVPGMAFLANPSLFVGLMAWSLTASPLINRAANGWSAKMLAAIEAQGDILAFSDRFYNLANEDHPPSFGDLDLARTQMETIKYKWRTVLTNMSKNAKWDTNIFTNIFNQLWGKVT